MANHGPAYGDLAEMLAKREAGYDKQLEGLVCVSISGSRLTKFSSKIGLKAE